MLPNTKKNYFKRCIRKNTQEVMVNLILACINNKRTIINWAKSNSLQRFNFYQSYNFYQVGHRVTMSICLSGCLCAPSGAVFLNPLIGPEITWSVPGLSLVLPPSLLWKLGHLETWKLSNSELNSETQTLRNSETQRLGNPTQPPTEKIYIHIFLTRKRKYIYIHIYLFL